jgi:acetate kinase
MKAILPGVVLYLIGEKGMTVGEVQDLVYHECGLKGLSGISNDLRELQDSADPRAAFAIKYFVTRVGIYAGMLTAALGSLDALFTAGIGENSATVRAWIADKLAWLGAALDPRANVVGRLLISRPDSALYAIPADEEMMIARHTLSVLSRDSGRALVSENVARRRFA